MANAIKTLIECRNALADVRRLREDVMLMSKAVPIVGADSILRAKRQESEAAMKRRRADYTELIGRAMQVLDTLPRRERKVLYLYYVLGYTMHEVATDQRMDERTAYKQKKRGLEMLGRAGTAGGGEHAKVSDRG